MKKLTFLFVIVVISLTACKDESEVSIEPEITEPADYTPMEVGYYWLYEWVKVDSLGNETTVSFPGDSIYISKDTVINGLMYYKFENIEIAFPAYDKYLRDSNNYLVNSRGDILFSSTNFEDVLYSNVIEEILLIEYQMNHQDSVINVPFGMFETLDYEGTVYPLNPSYPYGVLYLHHFYGKGIGMVKSTTFWYSSPHNVYERRLVDSNVPAGENP